MSGDVDNVDEMWPRTSTTRKVRFSFTSRHVLSPFVSFQDRSVRPTSKDVGWREPSFSHLHDDHMTKPSMLEDVHCGRRIYLLYTETIATLVLISTVPPSGSRLPPHNATAI